MRELLELIEKNHTLPIEQLATMLDKTPQEVAKIIKQLEDDKIIVKYHTIINWDKVGVNTVTAIITVKITPQREVGFDAIAERIYRFPEVRSVYLISGGHDLQVMIEGESLKEVAHFVSTKLSTIEGVLSTNTHFMLKKYKEAGVIMEDREEHHRLAVSP